jgi:predicted nucleic acid-binding protein
VGGLVFDTGMLVALERRKQRATHFLELARRDRLKVHVPSPVFVEWWRGRTDLREDIRACFEIDYLDEATLRLAGETMRTIRSKHQSGVAVDVIVLASAAVRGDTVLTGEFSAAEPKVSAEDCAPTN